MTKKRISILERSEIGEFDQLCLMVSLVVFLIAIPIAESRFFDKTALYFGLNFILLIGLAGFRNRRAIFFPLMFFVVLEVPMIWASFFLDYRLLFMISSCAASAIFIYLAVALLDRVLRRRNASIQSLFGAVSSYLLLGLAWAVVYWAIERTDAEAFQFSHRVTLEMSEGQAVQTAFSQMVYFSFVTMSTLGYGDITPSDPITQTLTWLQSVLGQFYLAVAVAWLVNALPRSVTSASSVLPTDNPPD